MSTLKKSLHYFKPKQTTSEPKMNSNFFMYITALSAVSINNLMTNFNEVTRSQESINLQTTDTNWTFDLENEQHLLNLFPLCNGTNQSPININTNITHENQRLRLGLTAYDKPVSGLVVNKFPSFQLIPVSLVAPRPNVLVSTSVARSFNPYADSYYALNHIEFHWLPNKQQLHNQVQASIAASARSSLHQVDNSSFPLEIHFVHVNTKYASYEQSSKRSDGLLILVVFAVASTHESYIIDSLLDKLDSIPKPGKQVFVDEDNSTWRALLPEDTSRFYRYFGSTVAPPCHESVQWILFEEKLKLGARQLRRLGKYSFVSTSQPDASSRRQVNWTCQRRKLQFVGSRIVEQSFAKTKS